MLKPFDPPPSHCSLLSRFFPPPARYAANLRTLRGCLAVAAAQAARSAVKDLAKCSAWGPWKRSAAELQVTHMYKETCTHSQRSTAVR